MSFRLSFDFEVAEDLEVAQFVSKDFLRWLKENIDRGFSEEALSRKIKYRLSCDSDRSPHNYLEIDENGHAKKGKSNLF